MSDGETQALWIPGPLPSLNELLAGRAGGAGNRYAKLKKKWTQDIALLAKVGKLRKVRCVRLRCVWNERNRRRDPDGIVGGGRKLILDGLVMAGVLANDGWDQIAGFVDQWRVASPPGVMVFLHSVLSPVGNGGGGADTPSGVTSPGHGDFQTSGSAQSAHGEKGPSAPSPGRRVGDGEHRGRSGLGL